MTRGSKIVVSSIFGLLLLAGVYFAFFAPSSEQRPIDGVSEPSPLAGTDSLTLGPGPGLPPNSTTDSGSALGAVPGLAPSGAATGTAVGPSMNGFGDLTALPPPSTPNESIITPVQPQPINASAAPTVVGTLTPTTQPMVVPPTNSPEPQPKSAEKTATTAKAKPANYSSYTVKSGDTLSSIAGEWFRDVTRWKDIVAVNPGLSPQSLRVGQKINLPSKAGSPAEKLAGGKSGAKATKSATSAASPDSGKSTSGSQHVVAAGETLASIAAKAYGSGSSANWKRIYEANKSVIGANPSALKVGMKLVIPARQG